MKENYKCSEEQRERMLSYYYSHKQQILEQRRKERAKERQHKKEEQQRLKQHQYNSRLIQMYESWNLYILERLQSNPTLPQWMKHLMTLQVIQNNDRINQLEQNEQNSSTRR